jgi:3-dehydro-L-gulonate 2-dehydrogenase
MLATLLSAGNSTYKVGQKDFETGISQVYLCIYQEVFKDKGLQEKLLNEIIDYTHDVEHMKAGDKIYYPGERSALTREQNLKEGMPVSESVWEKIMAIADK